MFVHQIYEIKFHKNETILVLVQSNVQYQSWDVKLLTLSQIFLYKKTLPKYITKRYSCLLQQKSNVKKNISKKVNGKFSLEKYCQSIYAGENRYEQYIIIVKTVKRGSS